MGKKYQGYYISYPVGIVWEKNFTGRNSKG